MTIISDSVSSAFMPPESDSDSGYENNFPAMALPRPSSALVYFSGLPASSPPMTTPAPDPALSAFVPPESGSDSDYEINFDSSRSHPSRPLPRFSINGNMEMHLNGVLKVVLPGGSRVLPLCGDVLGA